jgi:hypothetical protein
MNDRRVAALVEELREKARRLHESCNDKQYRSWLHDDPDMRLEAILDRVKAEVLADIARSLEETLLPDREVEG